MGNISKEERARREAESKEQVTEKPVVEARKVVEAQKKDAPKVPYWKARVNK